MILAVADTCSIIWYLTESSRLGAGADAFFQAMEKGQGVLALSAISVCEIVYLQERFKIPQQTGDALAAMLNAPNPGLMALPVDVHLALELPKVPREKVPDLPDRIIAVTALRLRVPLLSPDERLQAADVNAIW
ncbi:MAG: PIN domain-containing protein [Planctomycetota bacterium]|nr:PIN domain-containing protein [Planctomycetota bacterium]